MQVDYSIELGSNDEHLEFPWRSPDGQLRYYDLKRQPELLLYVQEAVENQELGEFLVSANSPSSTMESAKCDAWITADLNEEEAIYGAACKFGSYVDLLFTEPEARVSFIQHEQWVKRMVQLLKQVPEISAAAEFIVRRCYYAFPENDAREGFYITSYLFGYGDDEADARKRWSIGLKLVENAILQLSAETVRKASISQR